MMDKVVLSNVAPNFNSEGIEHYFSWKFISKLRLICQIMFGRTLVEFIPFRKNCASSLIYFQSVHSDK